MEDTQCYKSEKQQPDDSHTLLSFTVNMDLCSLPFLSAFIPLLSVHTHLCAEGLPGAWRDVKAGEGKRNSITMETHLPQFLYDPWSIVDLRTWSCIIAQTCSAAHHRGRRRDNPVTQDDWCSNVSGRQLCGWLCVYL